MKYFFLFLSFVILYPFFFLFFRIYVNFYMNQKSIFPTYILPSYTDWIIRDSFLILLPMSKVARLVWCRSIVSFKGNVYPFHGYKIGHSGEALLLVWDSLPASSSDRTLVPSKIRTLYYQANLLKNLLKISKSNTCLTELSLLHWNRVRLK